jgi:hypothetical protein
MLRSPAYLAVVALALTGSALTRVASAQPAPPPSEQQRAEELYNAGDSAFKAALYDEAITKFTEAYRLTKAPLLLFNIAQAHRLKGDCRAAARVYRNYLKEDGAADRAKIEARIAEMDECAKTQPVGGTSGAGTGGGTSGDGGSGTTGAGTGGGGDGGTGGGDGGQGGTDGGDGGQGARLPDPGPTPVEGGGGGGWMRPVSYASLGLGGVGLVAGVWFLKAGRDANNNLDGCTPASPCTASQVDEWQADGKAANKRATISLVGGGVLAGAGVALFVLSGRSSERQLAVLPSADGVAVSWAGRF